MLVFVLFVGFLVFGLVLLKVLLVVFVDFVESEFVLFSLIGEGKIDRLFGCVVVVLLEFVMY